MILQTSLKFRRARFKISKKFWICFSIYLFLYIQIGYIGIHNCRIFVDFIFISTFYFFTVSYDVWFMDINTFLYDFVGICTPWHMGMILAQLFTNVYDAQIMKTAKLMIPLIGCLTLSRRVIITKTSIQSLLYHPSNY